jgi:hypothetical protein
VLITSGNNLSVVVATPDGSSPSFHVRDVEFFVAHCLVGVLSHASLSLVGSV